VTPTPARSSAKATREIRAGGCSGWIKERPRTAAVAMTCEVGGLSYAEVLRRAQEQVSLQDLGISETRVRKAVTVGIDRNRW